MTRIASVLVVIAVGLCVGCSVFQLQATDEAAEKSEYDRAIDIYTKYLSSQPNNAVTYNNRGIVYRKKGEYDRAIADFNEALRLKPDYAPAFNNRGFAYELKGDRRRAEQDYRQALALLSGYATARDNLARLTGEPPEAKPAPQVAQQQRPSIPPTQTATVASPAVAPAAQAAASVPSFAGDNLKRTALVVGNGAYRNADPLANPPNDARDVAAALEQLGFAVTDGIDLDRAELEQALLDFARAADDADIALVFYAGHGIQVDGENYLVPTDAKLDDWHDLRRLVSLDQVVRDAAGARRLGLVIVDACRDNPFARALRRSLGPARSAAVGRGLAPVDDAPPNTLVAFATAADDIASDGTGRHSPFTVALLRYLTDPQLEVGLLFRKVRDAVYRATDGRQVPYTYGSLGGDEIYLAARGR